MSFQEELASLLESTSHTLPGTCKLGGILGTVKEPVRERLQSALDMKGVIGSRRIAALINNNTQDTGGITVTRDLVVDHRNKACRCFKAVK